MANESDAPIWDRWWPRIVALTALALLVYETVIVNVDRPWLLLVLSGLATGVPVGVLVQAYLRRRGD